ncbi:hypothetical protein FE257_004635 [Aspergillus nanangensis]|uniref:Uncharacterized protein n=1 Tax=Aspergillus nanangensis TaxID=2582783 RepID=A0AAD4CYV4_ASPNN|nr:hypothetical protein FE257_004635 [Aspergillus nanangensis]
MSSIRNDDRTTGTDSSVESSSEIDRVLLPLRPSGVDTGRDILPNSVGSNDDSPVSEKPWEPSWERRESWSEQDRRHEFQTQLLDVEEGDEKGFTEVHEL